MILYKCKVNNNNTRKEVLKMKVSEMSKEEFRKLIESLREVAKELKED